MMEEEHAIEGERYREISSLTDGFTPPPDACNTFMVAYAMLQEFEEKLHEHIHLENNILFPKAIKEEENLRHTLN
jgi:regulator of cell morphogenesis and NO signaling